MSLRSWAIRGLILAGVGAVAACVWLANSWVSPERVREKVIDHLRQHLDDGVEVHVGSAHMRILGGIAVTDLKLTRPTSTGDVTILNVPAAVLYHDKEQLNRGQLVIKKVELDKPELFLERSGVGRWNLAGLFKETPVDKPDDKPVPTFVINDGTVHLADQGEQPLPNLTLTGVQLTLVNDPIMVLAVQQARATSKLLGPVLLWARYNRITRDLNLDVELADFPLGAATVDGAERFAPGLARHLSGLKATAAVTAKLQYAPGNAVKPWHHDIKVKVKDARYTHPELPWPVESINASFSVIDGRVTIDEARAEVAGAKVRLKLETRGDAPEPPADDDVLQRLENQLARVELNVDGLALDDSLFKNLPEKAQRFRAQFSPVGQVDVRYVFDRKDAGWKRIVELRPRRIAMNYEKFRYPVTDVRGVVTRTMLPTGDPVTTIDLVGIASKQTISINGQITGDGPDPGINLRVTGANVPLDEALYAALPDKYRGMVKKFAAEGRGDFVAEFVQAPGVNQCDNEFRIDIHDARINHSEFRYPLEQVKGRIFLRVSARDPGRPVRPGEPADLWPEREEMILDGFTAVHAGGAITLNGSKRPIPNSRDRRLALHLTGTHCPADMDLKALCGAFKIGGVWSTFNPTGKLSITADLELNDHGCDGDREQPFDATSDLKLGLVFSGATVTPSFFKYEIADFAGELEYKNSLVKLTRLSGRHGVSRVQLERGDVRFYTDGKVWADLRGLDVKPLIADAAFIKALPERLGSGLQSLSLQGRSELSVERLVVLTPPDAPGGSSPSLITRANYETMAPISYAAPLLRPEDVSPVAMLRTLSAPFPFSRPASFGALPSSTTDPLVYWSLKLKLMAASFDTGVVWDQAYGAVGCEGRYDSTHLGHVRGAIWLEKTNIAGQPLSRIAGRFRALPQAPNPARPGEFMPVELEFADLAGELFHGVLGGEAHVALTSPVRFNLWLKAADVQLEEVAKHYNLGSKNADLKGIAQAQLRLYNRPDSLTGRMMVEGWGVIDVPTGRMYNLPILFDLVKLFKFETPDKTAFEEAHASFSIQDDRVRVDQIDLIGRAVCLGGSGEFDTSGNYVKFDFYTIYSQVLARLINTPVGELTSFLSRNLFVIKLTRENGELKYKSELVPAVLDPARAVADRLRYRAGQLFGWR